MALTPVEEKFIIKLKEAGYTKEQQIEALKKQRQKQQAEQPADTKQMGFFERGRVGAEMASRPGEEITQQEAERLTQGGLEGTVASGAFRRAAGLSSMGERGLRRLTAPFVEGFGSQNKKDRQEFIQEETAAERILPQGFRGTTPEEKLGATIFDIGSTIGGGGLGQGVGRGVATAAGRTAAGRAVGQKVAEEATELGLRGVAGRATQRLPQFAGRTVGETAGFAASTQQRLPEADELAFAAAGDAIIGSIGKFFPKIGASGKAAAAEFYDKLRRGGVSRSSFNTRKLVEQTPELQKRAAELAKIQSEHLADEIRNPSAFAKIGEKISTTFDNAMVRRKEVGKKIGNFFKENAVDVDLAPVRSKLSEVAERYGVKINDTGEGLKITEFEGLQLNPGAQKRVQKAIDIFNEIQNAENKGLAMRRLVESIDDIQPNFKSNVAQQVGNVETAFLGDIESTLRDALNQAAESVEDQSFKELSRQYAELSNAKNLLNTRLGQEGSGGFQIAKQLFSEGKYGTEVQRALDVLNNFTADQVDLFTDASLAKMVSEYSGDNKAESLLNLAPGRQSVISATGELAGDALSGNAAFYESLLQDPELRSVPISIAKKLYDLALQSARPAVRAVSQDLFE